MAEVKETIAERKARRNVKLLREVADFIKKNPEKHDQMFFITCSKYDGSSYPEKVLKDIEKGKATDIACNTVCCVAGWAVLRSGITSKEVSPLDWFAAGQKVLGLTFKEAEMLFYSVMTPDAGKVLRALANGRPYDEIANKWDKYWGTERSFY